MGRVPELKNLRKRTYRITGRRAVLSAIPTFVLRPTHTLFGVKLAAVFGGLHHNFAPVLNASSLA